jgi:hypothetical protein
MYGKNHETYMTYIICLSNLTMFKRKHKFGLGHYMFEPIHWNVKEETDSDKYEKHHLL